MKIGGGLGIRTGLILITVGLFAAGCSSNSGGPVIPAFPSNTSYSSAPAFPISSPSATAPATSSAPAPTSSSTSPTTGTPITIDLSAQNQAFSLKTISVPAGAAVTINFSNKDAGMPHNFALYQSLANGQTEAIYVGSVVNGPASATYRFSAPAAGNSYFFECDIHPQIMNGRFVVTP